MIRFPTRRVAVELSSDAVWILFAAIMILWFLRLTGVLR